MDYKGPGAVPLALVQTSYYQPGRWWTTIKDPGRFIWQLYKLVIIKLGGEALRFETIALQSLHYTGPGRSFWHLQGGYGKGGLAGATVDLGRHYHYGMWWTTKDPGRSLWHLYKLIIINLGGEALRFETIAAQEETRKGSL